MTFGPLTDVAIFMLAIFMFGWCIRMLFQIESKSKPVTDYNRKEDNVAEDVERGYTFEYENADANECLDARLKCLRLAVHYSGTSDPDVALPLAEKYFDFIKYGLDKKE